MHLLHIYSFSVHLQEDNLVLLQNYIYHVFQFQNLLVLEELVFDFSFFVEFFVKKHDLSVLSQSFSIDFFQ